MVLYILVFPGCFAATAGTIVSGIVDVLSVELIDKKLKIDDSVGAISVHGVCGAVGTVLVGVFAEARFAGEGINGLLYGGGFI